MIVRPAREADHAAIRAQPFDQVGFVRLTEGGGEDVTDGGVVGLAGRPHDHQAPIFSASAWVIGLWALAWSSSARKRTASRAAMQPMPAAVTAWR